MVEQVGQDDRRWVSGEVVPGKKSMKSDAGEGVWRSKL